MGVAPEKLPVPSGGSRQCQSTLPFITGSLSVCNVGACQPAVGGLTMRGCGDLE